MKSLSLAILALLTTLPAVAAEPETIQGGCTVFRLDPAEAILPPTPFQLAINESKVVYKEGNVEYVVTPQNWKVNGGKYKIALDMKIQRDGAILAHSVALKNFELVLTADKSLPGITCW
ncbi:MAG: hypothetical protein EOP11_08110 [Proteobacteria bacterium]|nr:MAG: hypothetical protein EOP11_08110 [Pseudomonadota bacterium]